MKKLFIYLSVAVLGVAAASCQKELAVAEGGKGNVSITIQTPEVATKAIADGMNVNIVHYEIYKNEAGHKNSIEGTATTTGTPLIKGTVPMNAKGASLTLNLLQGQEYVGLFWAQVNGQSYYDVTDLREVKVAYPNESNSKTYANDEARAAFCQKKEFTTGRNVSVVLERPFAQINLGTTIADLNDDYKITLEQSSMTVKGVANTFDVAAMTAGTTANNVVFSLATVPYAFNPSETLTANNQTWAYAGMNYVLVPNDAATVDVTYSIKTDVGTVTRNVPVVPVKKNYRTNLLGNLLTQETAIEIIVDEKFNTPDLEPAPIYMAAANGGEFTLTENVTLAEPLIIQSSLTLDLGGYSITGGKEDSPEMSGSDISAIVVEKGATLTIVGEGNIVGTEYGVYVKNGNVVVKGGDIKAGTSAVQVYNGTATIEGGNFSATKSNDYVVNCIDANWKNGTAKVSITGGTFVGFNPANNAAEGVGTNFCAEGYSAVAEGNNYKVIRTTITTPEEFASAVAVAPVVTLANNVTVNEVVVLSGKATTINLNGKTLGYNGDDRLFKVQDGATLTINGEDGAVAVHSDNLNSGSTAAYIGTAYEGSKIVVNGGTHTTNGCTLYHAYSGTIEINSGVFNADETGYDPQGKYGHKYTLNMQDKTGAILVRGGSFKNYNPAYSQSENPVANFVAEGYQSVPRGDWYVVISEAAVFAADNEAVEAALDNRAINTIYLEGKEYVIEMYTNFPAKESLTIVGTEGTKVAFKNEQVQLERCKNFTIKNCEVLHMATKKWGMLVFGSRKSSNGVVTLSNCTFNGVGTQGIYINEDMNGAVYNIENCTFNGNFGSEGAITIQDNKNVEFTVNVNGCAFNNIPSTSHEVCLIYGNDDFTLNSDVELEVYKK